MAVAKPSIAELDPVWSQIRKEAETAIADEPLMGGLIHSSVLHHGSFERALAYRMSTKLASTEMSEQIFREIADEAWLRTRRLRGLHARISWRPSTATRPATGTCSLCCSSRDFRLFRPIVWATGYGRDRAQGSGIPRADACVGVFGVDIHPAARIGKGIMIDHAHSIVIGETAVLATMCRCCIR